MFRDQTDYKSTQDLSFESVWSQIECIKSHVGTSHLKIYVQRPDILQVNTGSFVQDPINPYRTSHKSYQDLSSRLMFRDQTDYKSTQDLSLTILVQSHSKHTLPARGLAILSLMSR